MEKQVVQADSIAPGVATGTLRFLPHVLPGPDEAKPEGARDAEAEVERFNDQAALLSAHLQEAAAQLDADGLSHEADIVRSHALILQDAEFGQGVEEAIRRSEAAAEGAVEQVLEAMAEPFRASAFPALADRASELRDLAIQLRRWLAGDRFSRLDEVLRGTPEAVLGVAELLPSVLLEGRRRGVRAVVVDRGTAFSHSAILAKSFAIPVVRVPSLALLRRYEGIPVLVDGDRGELVVAPDEQEQSRRHRTLPAAAALLSPRPLPVRIWVSILSPDELEGFDWRGVEGVGLYRTETLFMQRRNDFPAEDEQAEEYARLLALCDGRPVTVRTLDIGGDKPLPYLSLGPQDNPQLGLRAHRLFRYHPDLLIGQVRAILRAAAGRPVRIMYPMIESVGQWRFVTELTGDAVRSLQLGPSAFQSNFQQGPLIETPSAVWSFSRLLGVSDFIAVGTNDLVQYLFGADRTNANVASFYRPESPIVLQILKSLAEGARAAEKPLSVCGEMAADFQLLPVLVGLGIEDFSVAVGRVAPVRAYLESLSPETCRDLADRCLEADEADEVAELLADWPGAPEAGPPPASEVVDPVCKMVVDPASAPFSAPGDGHRHYFCSRRCMELFRSRPHPSGERGA